MGLDWVSDRVYLSSAIACEAGVWGWQTPFEDLLPPVLGYPDE